jgi:hypothetical protein
MRLEHAGVVDEHVDAAEAGGRLLHHPPHGVRVREVGAHDDVALAR